MPKIDKMLQLMKERGANRTVLRSDKPFQIHYGKAVTEGSVIPGAQLLEILQEITPPGLLPQLRSGGIFHFRHASPFGNYDCGVESSNGVLHLSVTIAKPQNAVAPQPTSLQVPQPPSVKREMYIHRNGQNLGPMPPEQAAEGVRTGQYSLQDLAVAPHMKTWESMQVVLDYFGVSVQPSQQLTPPSPQPYSPQPYSPSPQPQYFPQTDFSPLPRSPSSLLQSFLNEEQDPAAVERVIDRLKQICAPDEDILYIAVQKKPLVTIAPTSVALTSKRVIFFRPRTMGLTLSFEDYPWRAVADIHISEELLGSTFSVQLTNNARSFVDSLPKAQARKLYLFGQQMEEQMHSHRRDLMLEERRAGASSVNVNVNNSTSSLGTPPPTSSGMLAAGPPAADDPVAILKKLKTLLDQGLISQSDYDSKKVEVMSRL